MKSRHHHTRNTVSVALWCNKCRKSTYHSVSGRKSGHCMECAAKLETAHTAKPTEPPAEQRELFK